MNLKKSVKEVSSQIKDEKDFDSIEADLLKKHATDLKEPADGKEGKSAEANGIVKPSKETTEKTK